MFTFTLTLRLAVDYATKKGTNRVMTNQVIFLFVFVFSTKAVPNNEQSAQGHNRNDEKEGRWSGHSRTRTVDEILSV
jgi:hypothetical protein